MTRERLPSPFPSPLFCIPSRRTRAMLSPVFFLCISLLHPSSLSHPLQSLQSAQALLSISPNSLLSSLTPALHRPSLAVGISQTVSCDQLHLTLPPVRSTRVLVSATLSQPSRVLHVVLQPHCAYPLCPPAVSYSLRLAAPVDSSARVRVLLSKTGHNSTQVRLALPLLEPALRDTVLRCEGERRCLADAVRKACGRMWTLDRCGPECVINMMRKCQGEEVGVRRGARVVAGMFLGAASVAVVMVFVAGSCVAFAALPGEVVAVLARVVEMVTKRGGA